VGVVDGRGTAATAGTDPSFGRGRDIAVSRADGALGIMILSVVTVRFALIEKHAFCAS
jgi:hypothetical protein